jgi:hypothetical protein
MGRRGIIAGTLLLAAGAGCSDDLKGRLDDLNNAHPGDASGTELRQFRPTSPGLEVAVSADGSRLYTNEGTAVAVWCR